MIFIADIHTLYVTGVSKPYKVDLLEYHCNSKTEHILENLFCIETVWAPKIFDILYYLTRTLKTCILG